MKIVACLWVLASPALAWAHPASFATTVERCQEGSTAACTAVATRLARQLAGESSPGPRDRQMAEALAQSAVELVREEGAAVEGALWARVLSALFRGDDARLEASTDRELAHQVAARLVAAPLPQCLAACGEGYSDDAASLRACDDACVGVFKPADTTVASRPPARMGRTAGRHAGRRAPR